MTKPIEPYGEASGDPGHVPVQDQHFDRTSQAGEADLAAVLRRHGKVVHSRRFDSHGQGDATIGERHDPQTEKPSPFSYTTDFKKPKVRGEEAIVRALRKAYTRRQHHLTFNLLECGSQPADVYRALHRRAFDGRTKNPGKLPGTVHAVYLDGSNREQVKEFDRKTLELIAQKSGVTTAQLPDVFKPRERTEAEKQELKVDRKPRSAEVSGGASNPAGPRGKGGPQRSPARPAARRQMRQSATPKKKAQQSGANRSADRSAKTGESLTQMPTFRGQTQSVQGQGARRTRTGRPEKRAPSESQVAAAKARLGSQANVSSAPARTAETNVSRKKSRPTPAAPSDQTVAEAKARLAAGSDRNAAGQVRKARERVVGPTEGQRAAARGRLAADSATTRKGSTDGGSAEPNAKRATPQTQTRRARVGATRSSNTAAETVGPKKRPTKESGAEAPKQRISRSAGTRKQAATRRAIRASSKASTTQTSQAQSRTTTLKTAQPRTGKADSLTKQTAVRKVAGQPRPQTGAQKVAGAKSRQTGQTNKSTQRNPQTGPRLSR